MFYLGLRWPLVFWLKKVGPHPIIKTNNVDTSWAPMWELVCQADEQLPHWMYTLWVWLLVTETVAISAASRSSRVLATSWGPTLQARRGLSLYGGCCYDEEKLGRKVMGSNPGAGKVFHLWCLCRHWLSLNLDRNLALYFKTATSL